MYLMEHMKHKVSHAMGYGATHYNYMYFESALKKQIFYIFIFKALHIKSLQWDMGQMVHNLKGCKRVRMLYQSKCIIIVQMIHL